MQYELVRNAEVQVNSIFNEDGHPIAQIEIDGRFQHEFDASSRVSKNLEIMTPESLSERLTGGHFFIVDDKLFDFRDNSYNGFIHTDDSIHHLNEVIGIRSITPNSLRVHENTTSRSITLGARWSNHDIIVPEYRMGGEFTSELHFGWSPFMKNVNSAFKLTRLICLNGMRGLRSFMNTKIPLINRWEEHLEIANKQIQMKVNNMVSNRLVQMGKERASVAETTLLAQHAKARLNGNRSNHANKERINNIVNIVAPRRHLEHVYKDNVFTDNNIAAQHPAHLTTFDLYNIVTELRTHTHPTDKSTSVALDKLSNDLIFEHKRLQNVTHSSAPKRSMFSDPETAFYGLIS